MSDGIRLWHRPRPLESESPWKYPREREPTEQGGICESGVFRKRAHGFERARTRGYSGFVLGSLFRRH